MLVCVLVIIIILIILIIAVAVYYSNYSNQNYVYYDGQQYYRGDDGFKSRRKKSFFAGLFGGKSKFSNGSNGSTPPISSNSSIIYTANDIPYQFSPSSSAERALLGGNILAAQGNSIPDFYKQQGGANSSILPDGGGSSSCTNALSCIGKGSSPTCSGFGDEAVCQTGSACPQPNGNGSPSNGNVAPSNGFRNHFQNSPSTGTDLESVKQNKGISKINEIQNNELMFGKYKRNGNSLSNLEQQPNLPRGLSANNRSGAKITPEESSQAEQQQWLASYFDGSDPQNNSGLGNDLPSSTKIPSGDYSSYILNLVADPRLQENQHKWAEEMSPWSGTAFSPDDLEEAIEADLKFVGLRRPQATSQGSDTLFLTEADPHHLIGNSRFNFMGNTIN